MSVAATVTAMSIIARIGNTALAIGIAIVALVGLAVQPAAAAAPLESDTDASFSATCWYEYSFDLVNTTVYASAFKDCVYLEVPQPIGFSVQALVGNEWGNYWATFATGSGYIITGCPQWTTIRHSISKETIRCP